MQRYFPIILSLGLLPCAVRAAVPCPLEFAPQEGIVKPQEQPDRRELCLNGLWQFQPMPLSANFREGVDSAPDLPAPAPGGWDKTPIRIPSPWNVNSFADKDGLGGDFRTFPSYPKEWEKAKMGWLRKSFPVPADWKGKRVQIHFSALAGDAQIFVNGKPAGSHNGIFFPFDVDVTDAVVPGGENELLVGVRKPSLFDRKGEFGRRTYQAGSFWGQHVVGIWDDVSLVAVPAVRIADTCIRPLLDSDTLDVEVTVRNDTDNEAEASVGAVASRPSKKASRACSPSASAPTAPPSIRAMIRRSHFTRRGRSSMRSATPRPSHRLHANGLRLPRPSRHPLPLQLKSLPQKFSPGPKASCPAN